MDDTVNFENKMNQYLENINSIKSNFDSQIGGHGAFHKIKKMRIIHACAILDLDKYTDYLCKKGEKNTTETELVILSTCTSLLCVIHSIIRRCEKMAFKKNTLGPRTGPSGKERMSHLTTDTSDGMSPKHYSNANTSDIIGDMNSATIDRIIRDFKSEPVVKPVVKPVTQPVVQPVVQPATQPVIKPVVQPVVQPIVKPVVQPVIQSVTQPVQPAQKGGAITANFDVKKPTLVYYWADWCGVCTSFKPHWEKFKTIAQGLFPKLQVCELNVGKDTKLMALAEKVGVDGYPTFVLFINGKIMTYSPGGKTTDDISKFIKEHLK